MFYLQLSHYLDIVEMNLAYQISLRSEDFFSAMASQDQLQDHVGQTITEIKHLRYVIVILSVADCSNFNCLLYCFLKVVQDNDRATLLKMS